MKVPWECQYNFHLSPLERRFFCPQANLVGRGTLLLKMCAAPHARKHAEGSRKGFVRGRFAEAWWLIYTTKCFSACMAKLGETIPVEEKVLLRTRNVTLARRAKKAKTAGVLRGRFAEASRKLRGRVAPCLLASGHVAWVAQWSPSLHKLRRNTTSLKMTFVSAPMLAEAKLVNYAPRKVCGSKQ